MIDCHRHLNSYQIDLPFVHYHSCIIDQNVNSIELLSDKFSKSFNGVSFRKVEFEPFDTSLGSGRWSKYGLSRSDVSFFVSAPKNNMVTICVESFSCLKSDAYVSTSYHHIFASTHISNYINLPRRIKFKNILN